ncbi:MAG: FHA domain-containing protein [Pseudonocardia sp.]|nr:FHA domain-containing protein [Pseudonocardia sp.]
MKLVGIRGELAGRGISLGTEPMTLGRGSNNKVVLATPLASRMHSRLQWEEGAWTLYDCGSSNGTLVNGRRLQAAHRLSPGDEITLGDEVLRFEATAAVADPPTVLTTRDLHAPQVLRVTVSGGGPVGLSLALMLDDLMGAKVAVTVHEGRWTRHDGRVIWKTKAQGNSRRQQVVTIQSRQWTKLPTPVQERLFGGADHTEMWPAGPDSVDDLPPRNIRISYVEDQLLALANERPRITLIPEPFDAAAARDDLVGQHVLAICEGGRSRSREHFGDRFGAADSSPYSVDGQQLQDVVLGLRVKSDLPDPMTVLLTVAQNRFLLNSLRGEGFLNMRLTAEEAAEAVGIDPVRQVFTECVQAQPCVMERGADGSFTCSTHDTYFFPALRRNSPLWGRVEEGLRMFGIAEENLTAVTCFRLDMVARPRFTAQLFPPTATTPGTFGFLLGDAANAIHFWPGRGLNSGLASALSLARSLAGWQGRPLRDADFMRHEAMMGMLQYRHKSRAWRQMVTTDEQGRSQPIRDLIAHSIVEADAGANDRASDIASLLERLRRIRGRLEPRLVGLPDDATLREHLEHLSSETLHTLLVSEPWDSASVGGEEVDVDWLLPAVESVDRAVAA